MVAAGGGDEPGMSERGGRQSRGLREGDGGARGRGWAGSFDLLVGGRGWVEGRMREEDRGRRREGVDVCGWCRDAAAVDIYKRLSWEGRGDGNGRMGGWVDSRAMVQARLCDDYAEPRRTPAVGLASRRRSTMTGLGGGGGASSTVVQDADWRRQPATVASPQCNAARRRTAGPAHVPLVVCVPPLPPSSAAAALPLSSPPPGA